MQLQISVVIVGLSGICRVMRAGFFGLGLEFGAGLRSNCWGVFTAGAFGLCLFQLVWVIDQFQKLCTDHLRHIRGRQRAGLGVIVDVDVQSVHDVEVRIGKEFLDRSITHFRRDVFGDEAAEVGRGREGLCVFQSRRRGCRRCGNRRRDALDHGSR